MRSREKEVKLRVEVGGIIRALGIEAKIAKILYQEYWDGDGFDVELIDSNGNYRHWKQWFDGGEYLPPEGKR